MSKNISQNGIDLIKRFEGCVLHAYKPVPTEKYWTIGYGHYGSDVKTGQTITQAQAEALLKEDLHTYVSGVNSLVKVDINQNQFDALVSFSYNLGVGALKSSTLLDYVNEKQFAKAALEFGKWTHSNGKVLRGLVNRREAERQLFVKPVPVTTSHPVYHTVVSGETVSELAKQYGTTVSHIDAWNNLNSAYTIYVGQKLRVK